MTSSDSVPFLQNRLLASLPQDSIERLAPFLQPVPLPRRTALFQPGDALAHVYFPLSGLVSVMTITARGRVLETRLVGREGLLPVVALLGTERVPRQALIQANGEALRVPVAELREQARQAGALHDLLERYTAATLVHTAQTAVCNGLHVVEERLVRWLLLAHDRVEGATLPMSQRALGLLLGVRRASVTTAVGTLQQAGLIRSHFGQVEIVDRAGLVAAVCECYAVMRGATEQVFARLH